MRLPGGPVLSLENRNLALAIAAEWQQAGTEKGGTFTPEDLPFTRLAATAQERIASDPAPTIAALLRYAENDLLCYRAERPAELAARQEAQWQPWLDWARDKYGASLDIVRGIVHQPQPPEALAALALALSERNPFELAGLGILVPALGSLILGLAVGDSTLCAEDAHLLALLDELFEVEQWGEDHEADHRRRTLKADILSASRFIVISQRPSTAVEPQV